MGFWDFFGFGKKKLVKFFEMEKGHFDELRKQRKTIAVQGHESAPAHEIEAFKKEVHASGSSMFKQAKGAAKKLEVLPVLVSVFDDLISDHGFERANTIMVSGGAGTGKTTFCVQCLYNNALAGKKGIYLSLEEDVEKLKSHMLKNYGWDLDGLEQKGLLSFLKLDAIEIARTVEALTLREKENLIIELDELELPFKPDFVVIDSLSALSIAFENTDMYRKFIRYLFEKMESYEAVTLVIGETEQNPKIYSRAGIEEFLADGVVVLYNLKVGNARQQALEILKLRSSKHEKKIVPYSLGPKGIEIFPEQEVF